ncbi:iron-sulfur cluster repair di-iron protein [Ancylomarina salipaludis]|uniref:Iron-sulfur cluster repair di-iron protein n=1 Tax=Ancylomarina salipaludis TaxID=2501299 RepID=A0A4Q1JME0_9BACT|nr:iron-sulfur cluster repair di-iron protein [Ancylomarina salipaludis]RXQ95717.1 iron-sulfur cluster repair di-iron protein [Ancylomarina salipaludis]
MENLNKVLVGNIVAQHPHTAKIFKTYKMDFCCGGDITLEDICTKKQVDLSELEGKLQDVIKQAIPLKEDYNTWPLDTLVDHIENHYHRKAEADINDLMPHLDKVVRVHGEKHPHLPAIRSLFLELVSDLSDHMIKEEKILFPMIRESKGLVSPEMAEKLDIEISALHSEHETVGDILKQISNLTDNFTPPEGACRTYRLVYQLLELFQDALHIHVHLENNIVFKKIINQK